MNPKNAKPPSRKAIKALRKRLGLTQASLAEVLAVSANTVSRWEQGVSVPNSDPAKQLRLLLQGGKPPSLAARAALLTNMQQTILGNMDRAKSYGCSDREVRKTAQKAVDEWRKE